MGDTETQAVRDQSEALQFRVQSAAAAAGEEMSAAPMNAVMAELGAIPHPSVQQRAATVIRMLEVWRGRVGVVRDDTARANMSAAIDMTEAAARKPDLEAVRRGLAVLERDWQAYLPHHIAEASAAAVVPACRDWRDHNLQQLTETSNPVKLQSGRPEVADWERRLDRARRGLLSVLPEEAKTTEACLGPVLDNGREVIAVSGEVFTDVVADVPIPPQARLDAAQTSGVADAIVLAQRLMAEPRDLKLTVTTSEADRIAGQPILFTLGGLDPDWGSSVSVTVYWDNSSVPFTSDAEKLRQGERLEHTYKAGTVYPVAIAGDRPSPSASRLVASPDASEMGSSATELSVQPSPTTRAERLADMFLTAQSGTLNYGETKVLTGTSTAFSTSQANDAVLLFALSNFFSSNKTQAFTWPSGFTQLGEVNENTLGQASIGTAWHIQSASGTTGALTVNWSTSLGSSSPLWEIFSLALQPAAG